MKTLTMLFLSLLAASAVADNDRGFYLGAGAGISRFDDGSIFDREGDEIKFSVAELLAGYKYNAALGIDLRLGRSTSDETSQDGLEQELAIDGYESVYYRPELSNPEAKLYALIGYSQLERSATVAEVETLEEESGTSYGIGIGFTINAHSNINFEYRRLIDNSDYKVDLRTINFDYRF